MDSGKHTCDLQSSCSFFSCSWRSSFLLFILCLTLMDLCPPGFHSIAFCWTVFITSALSIFTSYNMNSKTTHFLVLNCYCSCSSPQIQFQSSVSNIKFTTFFPWKLIFLHIFCISVNGTQYPSISYRMTFPLLTPNSITKIYSIFFLNSFFNLSYFLHLHFLSSGSRHHLLTITYSHYLLRVYHVLDWYHGLIYFIKKSLIQP